jgi:hypothetical protein
VERTFSSLEEILTMNFRRAQDVAATLFDVPKDFKPADPGAAAH